MRYDKINKRDFVDAYQWAYGTSKKEAEYILKISNCKKVILRVNSTL